MAEQFPTASEIDPSSPQSLSMAYETDKGTAFHAVNPHYGEVILPKEGISVDIYDQWAAEEVASEIGAFEELLINGNASNLQEAFSGLSYLSALHVSQSHIDAIDSILGTKEFGQMIASEQIRILSDMPKSSDQLSHVMGSNPQMVVSSGALKPKTGHKTYHSRTGLAKGPVSQMNASVKSHVSELVERRANHRKVHGDNAPAIDTDEGTNGLHSVLVHFSELPFPDNFSGAYFPRATVMERTPIAILGQDNKVQYGAAGIKDGGDEAHHKAGRDAIRDRFARVAIELSPELQNELMDRAPSNDIAFMADTTSAESAVDFEYPLEDSVLFLHHEAALKVIEEAVTDTSDPTLISPVLRRKITEAVDSGKDNALQIVLTNFVYNALDIRERINSGEEVNYQSPEAATFWTSIVESVSKIAEDSGLKAEDSIPHRIVYTALLRLALQARGHSKEWTDNNVFLAAGNSNDDKGYDAYAQRMKQAWLDKHEGFSYIQARAEKLQFDQVDLMMQLPAYKN